MKFPTHQLAEILSLLREHGPPSGLDLVRRSRFLSRGTVYVYLNHLIDRGHVRRHGRKYAVVSDAESGA